MGHLDLGLTARSGLDGIDCTGLAHIKEHLKNSGQTQHTHEVFQDRVSRRAVLSLLWEKIP